MITEVEVFSIEDKEKSIKIERIDSHEKILITVKLYGSEDLFMDLYVNFSDIKKAIMKLDA